MTERKRPWPTDKNIEDFAGLIAKKHRLDGDLIPAIKLAMQHFGALPPEPVPISERPWERKGWCDAEGRCWWFTDGDLTGSGESEWVLITNGNGRQWGDFCLPHWALPVPKT